MARHIDENEPVTVLPDAEVLNLCREAMECDRIINAERKGASFERPEIKTVLEPSERSLPSEGWHDSPASSNETPPRQSAACSTGRANDRTPFAAWRRT